MSFRANAVAERWHNVQFNRGRLLLGAVGAHHFADKTKACIGAHPRIVVADPNPNVTPGEFRRRQPNRRLHSFEFVQRRQICDRRERSLLIAQPLVSECARMTSLQWKKILSLRG